MVKMGMRQQDRLDFHTFCSTYKRSRIHSGVDNHAALRISSGEQIGIGLERSQIIGTNIQHTDQKPEIRLRSSLAITACDSVPSP
ncbi:hypothetical protein D3C80_1649320 [compost metagenome]